MNESDSVCEFNYNQLVHLHGPGPHPCADCGAVLHSASCHLHGGDFICSTCATAPEDAQERQYQECHHLEHYDASGGAYWDH